MSFDEYKESLLKEERLLCASEKNVVSDVRAEDWHEVRDWSDGAMVDEEDGTGLSEADIDWTLLGEAIQAGNLLFLSGMLPIVDHKPKYLGRIGKELDRDAARDAAYVSALSALAAAKEHLGSLDRITRVVRLGVFMATYGDFFDQPFVADAASDLFKDIFDAEKLPVRQVIGVASLPLGTPIELEVIFEIAV